MLQRIIHHTLVVLLGAVVFLALCATVGIPPSQPEHASALDSVPAAESIR